MRSLTIAIAPLLFAAPLLGAEGGLLRLPAADAPPAVLALGDLSGTTAFALSRDAGRAASAVPDDDKKQRSVVRFAGPGDAAPREVRVNGDVRDLVFSPAADELFAIAVRRPKRSIPQAFLVRIDTGTAKTIREIVLPLQVQDADLLGSGTLVVASRGDLRTFDLPSFASGPLYRLDGDNLAVASVPGSSRVLVGRSDAVLVVDLEDRQGRDGLPVREHVAVPSPVASLVVDPAGRLAFARLDDGRVLRIGIDPLRVAGDEGTAHAIAWPGSPAPVPSPEALPPRVPPPPVPAPLKVEAPPSPPKVEAPPPAPPAPAPAKVEAPPPAPPKPAPVKVEAPAKVEVPPPAPPEPAPVKVEAPPAPAPPKVEVPPPAPPAAAENAQVRGTIGGPGAALVVFVVAFGPDNVLREAARVRPAADGSWSLSGLPGGTYRIALDGGGGRVLQTSPPFRSVTVAGSVPVVVDTFDVAGALGER